MGGGIRHNEDIMHSFQNFIVRLIPNHPPPLETRIWKLVVRALPPTSITAGANLCIFMFTDFKNNRFQKKLLIQNMIYEYSPLVKIQ